MDFDLLMFKIKKLPLTGLDYVPCTQLLISYSHPHTPQQLSHMTISGFSPISHLVSLIVGRECRPPNVMTENGQPPIL